MSKARERYREIKARLGARRAPAMPAKVASFDPTAIVLGFDRDNAPFRISRAQLRTHRLVIAGTGSGKSNLLLASMRQELLSGCATWLIDNFGNHPEDGVYRHYLAWLERTGLADQRTIHLIDPNERHFVVGLNFLYLPDGVDPSTIASSVMTAVEVEFGDENSLGTPRTRRILTALFAAAAELHLTMAELVYLIDPLDAHGLRAWAIEQLADPYARLVLADLHEMARAEKGSRQFREQVEGPLNRLSEFLRSEALRTAVGLYDVHLDFRQALEEGHLVLTNLEPGPRLSPAEGMQLGKLIVRATLDAAKQRRCFREQVFLHVDECHNYLTRDFPDALTACRKLGLGISAYMQYAAQADAVGEHILPGLVNSTTTRILGKQNSISSAETIVPDVVTLPLELPVQASVRPVVVGHRIRDFASRSQAHHHGRSHGVATSSMEARGRAVSVGESQSSGHVRGRSVGTSDSESRGRTDAHASAFTASAGVSEFSAQTLPGEAAYSLTTPMPLSLGLGTGVSQSTAHAASSSHADSLQLSTSRSHSESTSEITTSGTSYAESLSSAVGTGRSQSVSTSEGISESTGTTEGIEPIYESLPTSFHSLQNVVHMAAEKLLDLPVGQFLVRSGSRTATVRVPLAERILLTDDEFAALKARILARSPSALPRDAALAEIARRHKQLGIVVAGFPADPPRWQEREPAVVHSAPKRRDGEVK
ncbi:MAG: hypothetical protein AB7F99_00695 [Vicinamibacterales bacterium]